MMTTETHLLTLVIPRHPTVKIFRADNTITALGTKDTLTGEDVLPGFRVSVSDIF